MAEVSELSQFVIDLESGNDAFNNLSEAELIGTDTDGNRYDPCDICIAMQEDLLITTNYSCGQIVCNHDRSIDFNLDSSAPMEWQLDDNEEENKTIDLTKSPTKRQQKMTEMLSISSKTELLPQPISILDITETPSPATMIRNPKRRLELSGTLQ